MHGFVRRLDARPHKRAYLSLARGPERARGPRAAHPAAAVSARTGGEDTASAPVPCACGQGVVLCRWPGRQE